MKLCLINDLPLFSTPHDAGAFDDAIRTQIDTACLRSPSAMTYVGFEELLRIWDATLSGPTANVILLVGTRPPLLASRAPTATAPARIVQLSTRRVHDAAGQTASVRVIGCAATPQPCVSPLTCWWQTTWPCRPRPCTPF
jgi:hypothetical protein